MRQFFQQLSPLQRFLTMVGVGTLITLTTGMVSGRISHRWGPTPDAIAAARHLEQLPEQIGDWKLVSSGKMSDFALATLMCAGYVNRTYVDTSTNEEISLAIIVGPSGPTAVHTPEICYSSRDYAIKESREAQTITDRSGVDHGFWRTILRKTDPTAEQLCVYYAWTADGKWIASESPRIELASNPMLFKLQLAAPVPPGPMKEGNPGQRFLTDLLNADWDITGPTKSKEQGEAT